MVTFKVKLMLLAFLLLLSFPLFTYKTFSVYLSSFVCSLHITLASESWLSKSGRISQFGTYSFSLPKPQWLSLVPGRLLTSGSTWGSRDPWYLPLPRFPFHIFNRRAFFCEPQGFFFFLRTSAISFFWGFSSFGGPSLSFSTQRRF